MAFDLLTLLSAGGGNPSISPNSAAVAYSSAAEEDPANTSARLAAVASVLNPSDSDFKIYSMSFVHESGNLAFNFLDYVHIHIFVSSFFIAVLKHKCQRNVRIARK